MTKTKNFLSLLCALAALTVSAPVAGAEPNVSTAAATRPLVQVPCPAGTTNYGGSAQPYSCIAVFQDMSGHSVGLRQGRSGPENSAFGLLHAQLDHGVEERTIELIIQDQAAGILQAGTRYKYGSTFRFDGVGVVSVEIIEDRSPSSAAPDSYALGIVTAYCRQGDQNAPIEDHCPPEVNNI